MFFQSIEFYVVAAMVAAMIVGFMAKPARKGAARQFLIEADLISAGSTTPMLKVEALGDGNVILRREGLQGVTSSGIVKMLVTIIGNDITIEESVAAGSAWSDDADTAVACLDMLGNDRYHLRYICDKTAGDRFCAFTLNNRPGFKSERALKN